MRGGGWDAQDFYQTQYELLKSRNLARRVIDQLGLEPQTRKKTDEETQSFLGNLASSLQVWLAGILGAETKTTADPGQTEPELPPPAAQEGALLGNLMIDPVRNSRLVKISYDSPRPAEAAAVANAIANNFINMCPAPCDYIPRRSYPLFLARDVLRLLGEEARSARQESRTTSPRSTQETGHP
jgi:uncharacterized protein involved in exopolysaccharide biosynthesis